MDAAALTAQKHRDRRNGTRTDPYQLPMTLQPWTREDWQDEANCLGVDPDLFFPEHNASTAVVREARKVCAGCHVRDACLEYALRRNLRAGIFGGKTPKERQAINHARIIAGRAS